MFFFCEISEVNKLTGYNKTNSTEKKTKSYYKSKHEGPVDEYCVDTHPLSPPAAAGVWAQAVNWGTIGDRNLNAAEDAGNEKPNPCSTPASSLKANHPAGSQTSSPVQRAEHRTSVFVKSNF